MTGYRRGRLAVLSLFCLIAAPAGATARHEFDIAAGPLGPAIAQLAAQGDLDIGTTDPGVADARTRGVHGLFDARGALDRLLKGSGYRAMPIDISTFRLIRASPGVTTRSVRLPPVAAPAESRPAEAIIVTASKQSAPLLRFPGSVTIIGAPISGQFGQGDMRDLHGIAAVTSILQSTEQGDGRNKIFIRGIADSSFAGPTRSTAAVYFGDVQLGYNGADPNLNLYDIESVEILEGPQGALYGAGSIGGIVRLNPAPPDTARFAMSGALTAAVTQDGAPSYGVSSMINLPFDAGRAAVRAVGYDTRDGGYIDDVGRRLRDINRTTTRGGRVAMRLRPDRQWTIDLSMAMQGIRAPDTQYSTTGTPPLTRASMIAQPFEGDLLLVRGVVSKSWDSGLRLLSATGQVWNDTDARFDASSLTRPAMPFAYDTHGRSRLTVQETRLSRAAANGSSWLLGLSYIRHRDAILRELGPPGQPHDIVGVTNIATDLSGFGEATVAIDRRFSLTGGGRLTLTRTDGKPVFARNGARPIHGRRSKRLSPTIAANMLIRPRLDWFIRYGSGFRTGGLAVAPGVGRVADFTPDTIQVLETGLRLIREGPVGFAGSASLSHARWSKIQADLIDRRGFPTTTNVGDGRITGLELNLDWVPVEDLRLHGTAFFNASRLVDPIQRLSRQAGDDLPDTPHFAADLSASYDWKLRPDNRISLSGTLTYNGHSYVGFGPALNVRQGGYGVLNLQAAWKGKGVGAFLVLENVANVRSTRFALGNPFGIADRNQRTPLRPRTLRLTLNFDR